MNILVLTSLFPIPENPQKGIFVYNMLRSMKEKVKFVVVVPVPCLFLSRGSMNKQVREGFREKLLETLPNVDDIIYVEYPFLPRFFHPFFALFLYLKLKKLLHPLMRERNVHLIHSHFLFPEGIIAAKLGEDFSIKAICTIHGSDINVIAHRLYWKPFLSYALSKLSGLTFVSKDLKKTFLSQILKDRQLKNLNLTVISNGFADWVIPTGVHMDEQIIEQLRKSAKKIILFVGNLIKVKRPDIVLESLVHVKNRGFNATLVVIGEGPRKVEMMTKAMRLNLQKGEDLIFLGRLSHERVLFWMKEADVLILTSDKEGMPSVVLESLSVGTPVVATAVGGVPEVILDGVNGFLCQKNNPADTAVCLIKALSRSWDREKIKATVKAYAWTVLSKQWYNYYKSVLET